MPDTASLRDPAEHVRRRLEVLVGGRSDREVALVGRVVQGFGGKALGLLAALDEAVQALDGESAVQHVHALKGSALNLGSVDLAALCERLEADGRNAGRLPDDDQRELLADEVSRFVRLLAEVGSQALQP